MGAGWDAATALARRNPIPSNVHTGAHPQLRSISHPVTWPLPGPDHTPPSTHSPTLTLLLAVDFSAALCLNITPSTPSTASHTANRRLSFSKWHAQDGHHRTHPGILSLNIALHFSPTVPNLPSSSFHIRASRLQTEHRCQITLASLLVSGLPLYGTEATHPIAELEPTYGPSHLPSTHCGEFTVLKCNQGLVVQ